MKIVFLLATLILFPALSFAQTQNVSFALIWQHVSGQDPKVNDIPDGFNIERALGQGVFARVGQTATGVLNYTDTIAGDTGGTQYCYRVNAFNKVGGSPYSGVACGTSPKISVPPNAPSGLTTQPMSTSQIELKFQDNADNEDGFYVSWQSWSPARHGVITLAINDTSYIHRGLRRGRTYCYEATAFIGSVESVPSNQSCAETLR